MKAIDFVVVGAVEGASSGTRLGLGIETLENDPTVKRCPGPAVDRLIVTRPAGAPASWPAGILGEKDRLGRAVRNLTPARHMVLLQYSLKIPGPLNQAFL